MHDLHLWTLDGRSGILTAHLRLDDPDRWQEVQAAARKLLVAVVVVAHVTLQVEGHGDCPEGHDCSARQSGPVHAHAH